jgi:hypothetical protein
VEWHSLLQTLLTLLFGAGLGHVGSWLNEHRAERRAASLRQSQRRQEIDDRVYSDRRSAYMDFWDQLISAATVLSRHQSAVSWNELAPLLNDSQLRPVPPIELQDRWQEPLYHSLLRLRFYTPKDTDKAATNSYTRLFQLVSEWDDDLWESYEESEKAFIANARRDLGVDADVSSEVTLAK